MYAIKSVQGNICYIMDLDDGESDLELTKAETFDTVKHGNPILGVDTASRKIINLASVVMLGIVVYEKLIKTQCEDACVACVKK